MANIASFCILALYLYGRSLHAKNNPLHRKLMLVAFAADLLLVGALVVGRNALGKVAEGAMSFPLTIHVPIAVTTIVFYFFTVYAGIRLYQGFPVRRRLYWLDKVLTTMRILTFVTSVWVQFSAH